MRTTTGLRAVLVAVWLANCSERPADVGGPAKGGAPATSAAPASGMCAEHGVLEAICTKCNPKLIPVFQAKGDWCTEHGFPESVCPLCHPELGGKPSRDVSNDGAPPDGLRVRLKGKDTALLAGIETAPVAERPGAFAVSAPVRIAYDATRLARVNGRSPGVVRALNVDIGSNVKKGAPLLTIDSADVGADRARLTAAGVRIRVAQENFRRQSQLVEEGISSRTSLLSAQQELESAKAEEAALIAALSVLGGGAAGTGRYTLTSPLAGTVTERQVNIGRYVDTTEVLLEIVDTTHVWAEADVAEGDLSRLSVGQRVELGFDSLPNRKFEGRISYVAPSVDPHTRTARARIPLTNADGALRANLYGRARVAAGKASTALTVPHGAVQQAKGARVVFVKVAPGEYETRRVELGAGDDDSVEIRKGLRPGEEVVTTGSFLLKTETLKDSIGAGCCEGE